MVVLGMRPHVLKQREVGALALHLELLKWARENDCPWDEKTCSVAAKKGHFEALARNIKMGQRSAKRSAARKKLSLG
jgi:hypothetical protein